MLSPEVEMELRRDIHVPNESDAFVFTSASQRGRGLMPGEADWSAAVAACDLLPLLVESEDPATVRVLVGGELDAAERDEWVGRLRGALRIPDGQLALCGGAAYVLDAADWTAEYARIVEVPPGDYSATLYCYLSAPNGGLCLAAAGNDEPLGAWFRRTRAGEDMPIWLHNRCVNDPDMDPGNRAQWKRRSEKSGGRVVDFLLHLEPSDALVSVAIGDHGFGEAADCRKPEIFPIGLPALDQEGTNGDEGATDDPVAVVDFQSRVGSFAVEPIAGGPVAVPAHRLVRVARLAWMCHPYTQPSLQISSDAKLNFDDVEGVEVRREGRVVSIGFENTGQPAGAEAAMVAVGKQLRDLPDGSEILFETARLGQPRDARPVGVLRFQGAVNAGTWEIRSAFPRVDAKVLREALSVAEAMEAPRRFVARDEDEAQQIAERATRHAAECFALNPLQHSGAELILQRRDPTALWQVVVRAFWMRYAGIFPLQDFDQHP